MAGGHASWLTPVTGLSTWSLRRCRSLPGPQSYKICWSQCCQTGAPDDASWCLWCPVLFSRAGRPHLRHSRSPSTTELARHGAYGRYGKEKHAKLRTGTDVPGCGSRSGTTENISGSWNRYHIGYVGLVRKDLPSLESTHGRTHQTHGRQAGPSALHPSASPSGAVSGLQAQHCRYCVISANQRSATASPIRCLCSAGCCLETVF